MSQNRRRFVLSPRPHWGSIQRSPGLAGCMGQGERRDKRGKRTKKKGEGIGMTCSNGSGGWTPLNPLLPFCCGFVVQRIVQNAVQQIHNRSKQVEFGFGQQVLQQVVQHFDKPRRGLVLQLVVDLKQTFDLLWIWSHSSLQLTASCRNVT